MSRHAERVGGASGSSGPGRIFAVTRWVAVAIIPFLVAAAFLLFTFPQRSGELFAWQIEPPLSAFLLASAYVGGIWFFVGVVVSRRWQHVRHGFPAVVVFSGALLFATVTHLDRFSSNLSFAVWMILYATTPFVVAALAIAQRREDPGTADSPDAEIPRWAAGALAAIGVSALAFGAVVFAAPTAAIAWWPWTVTPLTAQVTGAVLSLTGVVNAALVRDRRWSAFRVLFQAQCLSLAAIAISLIAGRDDLQWDRPLTPVFVGLVAVALVGYLSFTLWCERRLRHRAS